MLVLQHLSLLLLLILLLQVDGVEAATQNQDGFGFGLASSELDRTWRHKLDVAGWRRGGWNLGTEVPVRRQSQWGRDECEAILAARREGATQHDEERQWGGGNLVDLWWLVNAGSRKETREAVWARRDSCAHAEEEEQKVKRLGD